MKIRKDYTCPVEIHEPERAAEKAAKILKKFRSENKPIIHVQHMFNVD